MSLAPRKAQPVGSLNPSIEVSLLNELNPLASRPRDLAGANMKSDKRMLLGGLCAMAALAIVVFKLTSQTASKEALPRARSVVRPNVSTSSAIQPTEKIVLQNHPPVDWKKEFQTSTDYFPLIAKAAKAALQGDGRAAYYVSRKWLLCAALANQYSRVEHPEEKFNDDMSQLAHAQPEWIEAQRREFHECSGFYKFNDPKGNDVFADLPSREGGYRSPQFWLDLAYQANDPLAQTVHAALALGSISPTPDQIQTAQADLNRAVISGDPDALFYAGMIVTNGHYVDRIDGYALSLAACDIGHDCSAANRAEPPFGDCVSEGKCPAGSVFSDWVTKNIGADGYAQAYARAQQIENALSQGNRSVLEQFTKLKN
jgi:hypothetical protein